jgi:hypothetical protein
LSHGNDKRFTSSTNQPGKAETAQSVLLLVMCWTVRGSNSGGGEGGSRFSALVQTGRGAHPASYTVVTGSFPGIKWPGRGFDHPPHIVRRSKRNKTVHLLPLWDFFACSGMNFTKHPIQAMGTSSLLLSGKRGYFPRV